MLSRPTGLSISESWFMAGLFHHLFHRPDAAGHRNKSVGEFGHPLLSSPQGGDDLAAMELRVRMTALLQLRGYHTMRRAAGWINASATTPIRPFMVPP